MQGCNYSQNIVAGQTINVFSPNYDKNKPYSPGTTCYWTATAPKGTRITVTCQDIRVPAVKLKSIVLARDLLI